MVLSLHPAASPAGQAERPRLPWPVPRRALDLLRFDVMATRAWVWLGLLGSLVGPGTAAAQPASDPSGLNAGGLTPPGGGTDDAYVPPPTVEEDLATAEKEDSGRGLEFVWLNAEAGIEFIGLQTLHANHLVDADLVESEQLGPVFGGGFGVRLVFLTLGPRFRFGSFPAWQLWSLDGELGLRIPIGRVEPYVTLAGGYVSAGALAANDILGGGEVAIHGANVRLGGGVDFYLSKAFSLGVAGTGEALFLTRPGVDPTALATADLGPDASSVQDLYAADGSGVGMALTGVAVVGLHF
jgi:hypothetical protein